MLWQIEILEPVTAQVTHRHSRWQASDDQLRRGVRGHHLAAVSGRGDPRRPVHVDPHIAVVMDAWAAGMNTHAHPDLFPVRPLTRDKGTLSIYRCGNGVLGSGEHHEEAVALGAHLDTAEPLPGAPLRHAAVIQSLLVSRPEPRQQQGRLLDV
jgi:hypothetical protein